jgi:ribosomal protein S12 methylthiotransferase accessory factor
MATVSGRGRDRRVRAGHDTGNHEVARRLNNKDVPTFAPNFTVYLLPPDAVCLYSEHRKFFLYGELYCALASTIGDGGWTIGELVRGLGRTFPAEKIREALTRLFDRGYLLPASSASTGVVAAYWASLGLPP